MKEFINNITDRFYNPGKALVIFAVILLICFYAIYQGRKIIEGPVLKINPPVQTAGSPLVEVDGYAAQIAFLTLDGRQIFIDEHGKFSEKLMLFPGYNIMTFEARDSFGRKTIKHIEIYRTDNGTS